MSDTVRVPLSKGKYALIDAVDAERVTAHKWYAIEHHGSWYARRRPRQAEGTRTIVSMHRFILSPGADEQVDHINGDGLDNRRANLRVCNNAQNSQNKHTRRPTKTGYKGVSHPPGWQRCMAQIGYRGRRIHLGMFDTPEEAARAYDAKARELYGEFAHTNFP